jgi:AmmeMemoRadiSam system protein A
MASLDPQTRSRLLKVARTAIESTLFGNSSTFGGPTTEDQAPWPLMERRGAFVTLRKRGQLRGCMGTFTPRDDLPATIRAMATAAAHDPRFVEFPIIAAEMKDIQIEISVLSPLKRIADPLDFEIGTHGIYIERSSAAGCFLPEVATEQGWDKETFLTECCRGKAGMSPDAWKHPDTEVSIFTVERIGDEGAVSQRPAPSRGCPHT